MISWIEGEVIDTWIQSKKSYVLINCQGLGYEIQILETLRENLDINKITLWIHLIKREDSDLLFGFKDKAKRDFFRDLIQVKGVGPQIGMSLLNKYELIEIFNSLKNEDRKLFNSVPGIGQKMTERLFLELKNKNIIPSELKNDLSTKSDDKDLRKEVKDLIYDVDLALKSLSYSSKDRKKVRNLIIAKIDESKTSEKNFINSFTFEDLLKDSLDYLEKNN